MTAIPILFIQSQQYFGADTLVHSLLMRGLPAEGFRVHIACDPVDLASPSNVYRRLQAIPNATMVPVSFGVSLSRSTARQKLKSLPQVARAAMSIADLARYVRRNRIAIVHGTEKPRDVLTTTALSSLTPARSVVHLHVKCHDRLSPLSSRGMHRADAIVCVSEFVRQSAIEKGYDPARVWSVLNGIDVGQWTPTCGCNVRFELGIEPRAPVVTIIGRIFSWKGHGQLLEAMPAVVRKFPDARLLIVGDDDPRSDIEGSELSRHLRREAVAQGLERNVIFTGYRADVRQLLAASDVFAMPSYEEPFGLVYAEAMAMGLPVVALNSGGTPEVVTHGITGLLSEPGDVNRLAEHLVCLLADAERRSAMGSAGSAHVRDRFNPERLCRDIAATYREVLKFNAKKPQNPKASHW